MNLKNSSFVLVLLVLFGCGSKGENPEVNPPPKPEVTNHEEIEVQIDEVVLAEIKKELEAYSIKWKTPGLDEVNKGVLIGQLLHELNFSVLKINDARFLFAELEKSDANTDFRKTAIELLKRKH